MNPNELDVIEARAAAATKGPWEHLTAPASDSEETPVEYLAASLTGEERLHVLISAGDDDYAYRLPAVTGDGPTSAANAEFIAHAREDVPALVAEVRRLREERAAAFADIRAIKGQRRYWPGKTA